MNLLLNFPGAGFASVANNLMEHLKNYPLNKFYVCWFSSVNTQDFNIWNCALQQPFKFEKKEIQRMKKQHDMHIIGWTKKQNKSDFLPRKNGILLNISNHTRQKYSTLAHRFIRPNPFVKRLIEKESNRMLKTKPGKIIALHIRGAGRTHGGVESIKKKVSLSNGVPIQFYFDLVDKIICEKDLIALFTDNDFTVEQVENRYTGQVYTPEKTLRSKDSFGERHEHTSKFVRRETTRQIVRDVFLMQQCDYFIHGNSNVSNLVLLLNPSLPHEDIYEPLTPVEN
jgi:hypothetical protein